MASIVAAIEEKLDAARRLRLERDHWAMREPAFRKYQVEIAPSLELFARLKPALEHIKALAGSTAASLRTLELTSANILRQLAIVSPPQELAPAHALIVSAVQLSQNAAKIRRDAVLAGDLSRAWNASSAAAGALMLGDKALSDIHAIVQRPKLSSP
jgi:hypothetical protein